MEMKEAYNPHKGMTRWLIFFTILGLSYATTGPDVEGTVKFSLCSVISLHTLYGITEAYINFMIQVKLCLTF